MTRWTAEIAVVGAGASGLAAASSLHAAGADVCLLEARDRIGGRAFTIRPPAGGAVELGAEYLHGTAPELFDLVRATGTAALDVGFAMYEYRDGALADGGDVWERTRHVLQHVDTSGGDRTADDFLRSLPSAVASDADKHRVRMLIEGFDAADAADASILALAEEWTGDANSTESRPADGYAPLLAHLAEPFAGTIRFGCVVERVAWENGARISGMQFGEPFEVTAKHCIVTVPAAVLKTRSITFDPPLPKAVRSALDCIATGPVVKLVLDFTEAFWERVNDGRYADGSFFIDPEGEIPTFWTLLPQRRPRLTAWCGGAAVRRLRARDRDAYVRTALRQLQKMFGVDAASMLCAAYHHDWQADPFALGAYTYLLANAGDARERLATPMGALIFAGEAAALGGESGTVAGALRSGYTAAKAIR